MTGLRVRVATWNVGMRGAETEGLDLRGWLLGDDERLVDVVVVGLQEVVGPWRALGLAGLEASVWGGDGRRVGAAGVTVVDAWVARALDALNGVAGGGGAATSGGVTRGGVTSGGVTSGGVTSGGAATSGGGSGGVATSGVTSGGAATGGVTSGGAATGGGGGSGGVATSGSDLSAAYGGDPSTNRNPRGPEDEGRRDDCRFRVVWAARAAGIGGIAFVRAGCERCRSAGRAGGHSPPPEIRRVACGSVGTGLLGVGANKGALGLSIDVSRDQQAAAPPTSLAFLVCHLGAHEGEGRCIWRNLEVAHILESLVLQDISMDRNEHGHVDPTLLRLPGDHHAVWLFGDLNYRLRGAKLNGARWAIDSAPVISMPKRSLVLSLIHSANVPSLIHSFDEIAFMRACRHGPIGAFQEHPIAFLPTYKFKTSLSHKSRSNKITRQPIAIFRSQPHTLFDETTGTSKTFSSNRMPAYCDRILFSGSLIHSHHRKSPNTLADNKNTDTNHTNNHDDHDDDDGRHPLTDTDAISHYWSEHGYSLSDHVPVCGNYTVSYASQSLDTPSSSSSPTHAPLVNGHAHRLNPRFSSHVWTWSLRLHLIQRKLARIAQSDAPHLVFFVLIILAIPLSRFVFVSS